MGKAKGKSGEDPSEIDAEGFLQHYKKMCQ